ncbi:hypothetical protein [uncultured Chitinophaga sp.]|jgi:hypothetical protein|uniref:hypothetical protein n=1 Tax=uncultured Chitinophaga sp. TaxID=339340 RepID=UPI002613467A|nr:hypothetical protein [uncultured Chitinophaga sp.]
MLQHLKLYGLLLLAIIPALRAQSQGRLKTFEQCAVKSGFRLTMGDTILVNCDSAMLMNSLTFQMYETAYQAYRKQNPRTAEIIKLYEALVIRQDSTILENQRDYNALKLKFDTLFNASLSQINQTSKDVGAVKQDLSNVNTTLNNTQVLITDAIDKVNTARRKSFLDKLYWGVGGLGIGVAVTAILMGIN